MGTPFPLGRPDVGLAPQQTARLRLGYFIDIQARRDEHADRCSGRVFLSNPCAILRAYDLELARLWASIVELGVTPGDLYAVERAADQ